MKRLRLILPTIPLFILFFFMTAAAGTVSYEFIQNTLVFTISFNGSYSNLKYSKADNASAPDKYISIDFETLEEMSFTSAKDQSVDFWDLPIRAARLTSEGAANRLTFYFSSSSGILEPAITTQDKTVKAVFQLPPVESSAAAPSAPAIGLGAYLQMFLGLGAVIVFILICYAVMKMFFKTNISTDIPGSGRLLGRVNLSLKQTLYFYEIGESIYILGGTDHTVNLVDKLTDPVEINVLKAGFAKRKNFSSYMKFFRKSAELKDEVADSGAILEDKLSKLRKK